MMAIVFGPVASRRFGSSLGIDLSPAQKCCNYDCLYCELAKAKVMDQSINPPSISEVMSELKAAIARFGATDVITLTANGEPTLYPHLSELITQINAIKSSQKSLILSNGSAVFYPERLNALNELDIVKFSLDSANQSTFRRIDRGLKNYNVDEMIDKMAQFSRQFKGELVLEVLVVAGLNDNEAEFSALNMAFDKIKPARVDISSIDRPPAHDVRGVSFERLGELLELITTAPALIAHITPLNAPKELKESELLKLLKMRPQSQYDIANNLSQSTKNILADLIKHGKIHSQKLAGVIFYRA